MFCDKTGTLTQNELIFKAFKVVGQPEIQPDNLNNPTDTEPNQADFDASIPESERKGQRVINSFTGTPGKLFA